MTMQRFAISDYHLGHENILKFKRDDGSPLRDFPSLDAMHQAIIDGWNSVVRDQDTCYIIGDVAIKKSALSVLHAMRGRKILIAGNHDLEDAKDYLKFFADVRGVVVFPHKAVLTHVPVHPESLLRPSWPRNIHGHLHANVVKDKWGKPDPKYINACCEQLNYVPKTIDELVEGK